jgi:hypothetical protein
VQAADTLESVQEVLELKERIVIYRGRQRRATDVDVTEPCPLQPGSVEISE